MDTVTRIFAALGASDLDQKSLASKIGVSPQLITNWRARRVSSYTKYIPQIAEALGVSVEWLLTGKGEDALEVIIPDDDSEDRITANRIFEALGRSPLDQKDLAMAVGVPASVVSQWRTGISKSYTKYLPLISKCLGVSVEWLLADDDKDEDKDDKETAAPKDSALSAEFARIFDSLTPENQNVVIADMLRRQREQ